MNSSPEGGGGFLQCDCARVPPGLSTVISESTFAYVRKLHQEESCSSSELPPPYYSNCWFPEQFLNSLAKS